MEMEFFILGHVILLAICFVAASGFTTDVKERITGETGPVLFKFGIVCLFLPLEITYWVLHWILVP